MKVLVLCELGEGFRRQVEPWQGVSIVPPAAFPAINPTELRETTVLVLRSGFTLDSSILQQIPNLKVVVRAGSGTDNIDGESLRERHVKLVRREGVSAKAVAELALWGTLALTRRAGTGMQSVIRGHWDKDVLVGEDLKDLQIAVWGGGPVGRACASRLAALGRKVTFAAWPSLDPKLPSTPPDTCLDTADIHVLAVPLRPATRGLFGEAALRRMRRVRPYIVNMARFEVVHFSLAARSLVRNELRGLYVDAVDERDLASVRPFLRTDVNLVVTPHLGAQRQDVLESIGAWVVKEISRHASETI